MVSKKVFIKILIGKEEEDILGNMDKKELKKLEKLFKRCKPVLDRLGKKECTDEDIRNFIKVIEENHCRNCKYTIDSSLPDHYYGNDKFWEE